MPITEQIVINDTTYIFTATFDSIRMFNNDEKNEGIASIRVPDIVKKLMPNFDNEKIISIKGDPVRVLRIFNKRTI